MSVVRAVIGSQRARWCATNSGLFKISLKSTANCGFDSRFKIATTLSPRLWRSYSSSSNVKSAASCAKVKTDDLKSVKSGANVKDKEIVYTGLLAGNVRRIKLFSLTTSVMGIGVQPYVYSQAVANGTATALTLPAFALVGILALLTPPLLHIITKKYVTSVEYIEKEGKYIATTYNLFALKRRIEFTPEDVTIPAVLGMFTTCAIKGKPVFLDAKSFTDQSHYIRIMGYDKPLDLQIEENDKEFNKQDATKM